ncbi:4'-phosphopantetheinyl transferase superfamily protein [Lentibacillus sp. N15]|uniref:4'-phosphopantetheinyl transferase family protein n=1 Tax=Lentibacillus songyuanensis TaxID=3136161 RepID=UPI0031BA4485
MVEVYVCQLPERKNRAMLLSLLAYTSTERQNYMLQFYHIEDAYRAIIGDLLLDHVLYKRLGVRLKEVAVDKNAYGKPFFPDYPFIKYNISHSGDYIACAIHSQRVGIDIEKVKLFDLRMAKQLFSASEYCAICHATNKNLACYNLWTLKESYIKMLGKGLAIPLDSFQMIKSSENEIKVIDMNKKKEVKDSICIQYPIAADYQLAVCAHGAVKADFQNEVKHIRLAQLITTLTRMTGFV